MTARIPLAIAQMHPHLGDLERNLALHEKLIQEAERGGARLILFPELSLTGYFLKDLVPAVALRVTDGRLDWLRAKSRDVALVVGFVEETPDFRYYNAAMYLEGGEVRHIHRKVYLPTYGIFDEQRYFAQGDRVAAFDSTFGRMALLICEDMWHPALPYLAVLDGAQVLLAVSNSPGRGLTADGRFANAIGWHHLNRTYAQLFTCAVAFAHRVGYEDGACFWGASEVLGPDGTPLAQAVALEEALLFATIDQDAIRRERLANPLLRDERPDLTLRTLKRILGEAPGEEAP